MSTRLTIYSVSLENVRTWVRQPGAGVLEESRRRAIAMDAQNRGIGSPSVVEAVDDIFGDRPKNPGAGDAYAQVWQDVIEYGESTRFDLGPLRWGWRYLEEASAELEAAGVPRELTPLSFVFDNPFSAPQAGNAPVVGHVAAQRVPELREVYGAVTVGTETAALVSVLLDAADETLHFNAFALSFDRPWPRQDLVTFYG
ncbi:hypothetical protein F5X71_21410 [Nocardia brasiliensis]|uniref:DUF7691 domain-containing protein n=1 Tax=Nocardia brasiliensis TaxID=37326 RepID=A0A6G9XUG3_NOCBR|nr:hypothetical protein [Nocardia brasiliensis]QIS04547.1 hypothetical protein F5X71_21410 [Nocardia brasiliensis]